MAEPRIIDIEPRSGAGIEVFTPRGDIPATIRKTFGRLYAPGAVAKDQHGHNFILYKDSNHEGVTMIIGVEHARPAGTDADIKLVHIPGGRAATAPHWGDYGAMRPTYAALEAWVEAHSLKRTGLSMEIYGDWYDDPAKVRTDIYLYLAVAI